MSNKNFVSIATGSYEYWSDKYNCKMKSHCVYTLDDKGQVWKYITVQKNFVLIDDLKPNFNQPEGFEIDDFGDGL